MDLRSRPGYVEEDLRQFVRLGEHRPVAGVHLDQPPVPTGQQLGYVVGRLGVTERALDVSRREVAERPFQHCGFGQRGTRVRRRTAHDPCDLLIGETVALEVGRGRDRPESSVLGDRCPHPGPAVRPGGDERFTIGRNTGVKEDHVRQPVADPLGGLTARDTRVAVTYQNDFTQVLALDLINDVLYVGLLTSRHTLLLSEAGQRQRVDAMAGRTQMRHHIVPRPRPESRTCNEHKVRHGRTVAERLDDRSGNTLDTRPSSRRERQHFSFRACWISGSALSSVKVTCQVTAARCRVSANSW